MYRDSNYRKAAEIIWKCWKNGTKINSLPDKLIPKNRSEAYHIQSFFEEFSSAPNVGWKIAATSAAGQNHIGASGPIAGRLLTEKILKSNEKLDLSKNKMSVAELEFVFKIGKTLTPRKKLYSQEEVMCSVENIFSGIEFPDSRFNNFDNIGEENLIADNACAHCFVLGSRMHDSWKSFDLSKHQVKLYIKNGKKEKGIGSNVLGDPRIALTWLVNELSMHNFTLFKDEFVTTGTSTVPLAIKEGDFLVADYGKLGKLEIQI